MGRYESLLEQPVAGTQGTDLICFTDDGAVASETWQVRHIEAAFPADPARSSRRPKILAHEYLADYDESLYIDNSVLLTAPADVAFGHLLASSAPMAVLRHSFRAALREEFSAVFKEGLDARSVVVEQLGDYAHTAPNVLAEPTLWGGMLARRHNVVAVRNAMQIWWEHVLRYSRRDQLSLPLALASARLEFLVHGLDNRRSAFHIWPDERVIRGRRRRPLPRDESHRIASLEAELDGLRLSKSWRSTRPARAVGSLAHGLRSNNLLGKVSESVRADGTGSTRGEDS